jgi:hypothetical protein
MIPTLQLLLDSFTNRNALGMGEARIKNPALGGVWWCG